MTLTAARSIYRAFQALCGAATAAGRRGETVECFRLADAAFEAKEVVPDRLWQECVEREGTKSCVER